jgi:hypothetical protein
MKKSFSEADELDGFDELQPADQDKIRKAWEDGMSPMRTFPRRHVRPKAMMVQMRRQSPRRNVPQQRKVMKVKHQSPRRHARPRRQVTRIWCSAFYHADSIAVHRSQMKKARAVDDDVEKEKPKKAPVSKSRSKAIILPFSLCAMNIDTSILRKLKMKTRR